jgi:hypothetical protein
MMNPWFGKAAILVANVVMVIIRAPHGKRSSATPVLKNRKGILEIVLLAIAWIAFFLSLIWIATPLFAFADYPLNPVALVAGSLLLFWASGFSTERTPIWARTGPSHCKCARSTSSLQTASIVGCVIRCT